MLILIISVRKEINISHVIFGIQNSFQGLLTALKINEINNQVLIQQVITGLISNLPIFLSNAYEIHL